MNVSWIKSFFEECCSPEKLRTCQWCHNWDLKSLSTLSLPGNKKKLNLFKKLLQGRALVLELIFSAHDWEQRLLQVLPRDGRADRAQRLGGGVRLMCLGHRRQVVENRSPTPPRSCEQKQNPPTAKIKKSELAESCKFKDLSLRQQIYILGTEFNKCTRVSNRCQQHRNDLKIPSQNFPAQMSLTW